MLAAPVCTLSGFKVSEGEGVGRAYSVVGVVYNVRADGDICVEMVREAIEYKGGLALQDRL